MTRHLTQLIGALAFAWITAFSPAARAPAGFALVAAPIRSQSDFTYCELLLSSDQAVQDRWYRSLSETAPTIRTADSVVRGQILGAYIAFGGFGRSEDGHARVVYHLSIVRPDGTTYHSQSDTRAEEGPVPADAGLLLAEQTVNVLFEPEDPLGTYTFRVVVRDLVSNAKAERTQTIDLVETEEGASFESEEELNDWLLGYFDAKEPLRVVHAFFDSHAFGLWETEDGAEIFDAFFAAVFEQNHWLYPLLAERCAKEDETVRANALRLLARCGDDVEKLDARVSKEDRDSLRRLRKESRRDVIEDAIESPGHLDMLWGSFLATGSYAPVRRIVSALELAEPEDEAAADAEPPSSPDDPRIIRAAALWSLESNAETYELVRDYCRWIVVNEKLSDHAREDLTAAMPE